MLSARLGRCTAPLIGPATDCRVPGMLIMSGSASSGLSSNTTENGRGGSVRMLSALLKRLFERLWDGLRKERRKRLALSRESASFPKISEVLLRNLDGLSGCSGATRAMCIRCGRRLRPWNIAKGGPAR